LSLAVEGSHWDVARLILGKGARADVALDARLTRVLAIEDKMTLLDYAEQEGKGRVLRELIAQASLPQ
jgi:hypothetical protein